MDEEKNKQATEDTGEGLQSETVTELDRADQIAERLKRENDRREALLTREEALEARRAVGGRAEAGSQPVKAPEMTDVEYYEKAKSGKLNVKKE